MSNNVFSETIDEFTQKICDALSVLPIDEQVEALNRVREKLHQVSPFRDEPVDCVVWQRQDRVSANDYNPNYVATPEFKSLRHSIGKFGYGMPVVTWQNDDGDDVTIDGEHRGRVGKEVNSIRVRVHGYLPVARVKKVFDDDGCRDAERNDVIQATILYNEARGEHGTKPMTAIIAELLRNGWSDTEVAKELGMDADEVLRFKHNTGLPELFRKHTYSTAWE